MNLERKIPTPDMAPSKVRAIARYNEALNLLLSLQQDLDAGVPETLVIQYVPAMEPSALEVYADKLTQLVAQYGRLVAEEVRTSCRGGDPGEESVDADLAIKNFFQGVLRPYVKA
jgi:hypothetical protein